MPFFKLFSKTATNFYSIFSTSNHIPEIKFGIFFGTLALLILNICAVEKIKRKIKEESFCKMINFNRYKIQKKISFLSLAEHK